MPVAEIKTGGNSFTKIPPLAPTPPYTPPPTPISQYPHPPLYPKGSGPRLGVGEPLREELGYYR